ncbi:MAG: hypothetical protein CMK89_01595 [Pseudomonadales bacterium]|nr:hypothetical protein [Pseudomonadales bacterium]
MPLRNKLGKLILSSCFVVAVDCYGAIDSEISVGTSGRWTDNVYFDADDQRNDVLGEASVNIAVSSIEEVTEFQLGYLITHENYLRDSFGNDNYVQGTGALNVHLLPSQLFWKSEIESEITRRDSTSVDVPANRDQRNFARTGLEYVSFLSARDQLLFNPYVSGTRFKQATYNNGNRVGLVVDWNHSLSPLMSAGLGCDGQKVDFSDGDGDYDTVRCNVSVSRRLNGGNLEVDLGQRKVNPEGGESFDGVAYSAAMTLVKEPHEFGVLLSRDIQDNTESLFSRDFVGGEGPIEINTDFKSLSIRKRFEIQYAYVFSSVQQFELVAYLDSDDVYKSRLDTDRTGVDAVFTRSITPQLEARLQYSFVKTEFADGTADQTVNYDDLYRILINKIFSKQFEAYAAIEAEKRRAESDLQGYEAYSAELGIVYTFK